jgi:hypothetical protein
MQNGLPATLLSLAVIAIFILLWGGVRLMRQGNRQKGLLMLAAAIVLFGNVLVWAWPLDG